MTKKTIIVAAVLLLAAALFVGAVSAEGPTEVATFEALKTAVAAGGEIILTDDIDIVDTKYVIPSGTITIDGAGHSIIGHKTDGGSNAGVLQVDSDATVTLKDITIIGPLTNGNSRPEGWVSGCNALKVYGEVTLEDVIFKGSTVSVVVGDTRATAPKGKLTVIGTISFINNDQGGINVNKYGTLVVASNAKIISDDNNYPSVWVDDGQTDGIDISTNANFGMVKQEALDNFYNKDIELGGLGKEFGAAYISGPATLGEDNVYYTDLDHTKSVVTYSGEFLYTTTIPTTFDFGKNLKLQSKVAVNFLVVDATKKVMMTVEALNPTDGDNNHVLKNGDKSVKYKMGKSDGKDDAWSPLEFTFLTEPTVEKNIYFTLLSRPTDTGTYTDRLTFTTAVVNA